MAGQRVHADAESDTRPAGSDLLEHLQVDLVRLTAATVLLGHRQRHQVGLAQQGEDVAGEPLGLLVLGGQGQQLAVGDVADEVDQVVRLRGRQLALDGHRQAFCRYCASSSSLRAWNVATLSSLICS